MGNSILVLSKDKIFIGFEVDFRVAYNVGSEGLGSGRKDYTLYISDINNRAYSYIYTREGS